MRVFRWTAFYVLWMVVVSTGFAQQQDQDKDKDKDRSYPELGTAIPVSMPDLNASKLKPGDTVVAKTTQLIDLSGEEIVPRGSKLIGHVVEAHPGKSSVLTLVFDTLRFRGADLPVRIALRAMAAPTLAYGSQHGEALDPSPIPVFMLFKQVGGDYFRQRDGPVFSSFGMKVGRSTDDGVFVRLFAEEPVRPADHVLCPASGVVESVGIFASDSCGLYGMGSLAAEDMVMTKPSGVAVRFTSSKRTIHIPPGTQALFQVVSDTAPPAVASQK